MNKNKIHETITKIKTTTPAHALEPQQLDFKRFPVSSHQEKQKKKLTSFLREYAFRFASSDCGTLLPGIEDSTIGPEAITGCHNYNIDEMRKMIFDGTPPIITEIEEIPQPKGMILVDKNAPHPEPINHDRLSHFHWIVQPATGQSRC